MEEHILEIYTLMLPINDSDIQKDFRDVIDGNDPKHFNSRFHDTPINTVLLAAQIQDFEKMKVILKALTHTGGFNDILVIGWEEDCMMMKTN